MIIEYQNIADRALKQLERIADRLREQNELLAELRYYLLAEEIKNN